MTFLEHTKNTKLANLLGTVLSEFTECCKLNNVWAEYLCNCSFVKYRFKLYKNLTIKPKN
jgi:hypothetical protein